MVKQVQESIFINQCTAQVSLLSYLYPRKNPLKYTLVLLNLQSTFDFSSFQRMYLRLFGSDTLQAFFRLVYLDSSFLRRFHAQVNNDDAAIVPPWDHLRKRDLTFRTPVNAPQLIRNWINADSLVIIESQSFNILSSGNIQIESIPVPQFSGASNFSSTATIFIENTVDDGGDDSTWGCLITATALVTATGPWGLTSTIESFMASSAHDSLLEFLGFCCQEINDLQRAGALQSALARIPSLDEEPPLLLPSQPQEETLAEFHDAEEAEEAASTMVDLAGPFPEEVSEVLSLSFRYLFKSIDENTAILKSIDARLERIEQKQKEAFTWKNLVENVWAKVPSIETHSSRHAVLVMGSAMTLAAITTLLYRTKARNSSVY